MRAPFTAPALMVASLMSAVVRLLSATSMLATAPVRMSTPRMVLFWILALVIELLATASVVAWATLRLPATTTAAMTAAPTAVAVRVAAVRTK